MEGQTVTTHIGRWSLKHSSVWHLRNEEVAFTPFHGGQLIFAKEGQHEYQQLVAAGMVDSDRSVLPNVGLREAAQQVAHVLGCSPQLRRKTMYALSYDDVPLECSVYRSDRRWYLEVGSVARPRLKPYISQDDWASMFSGKLVTRQAILNVLEAAIAVREVTGGVR